MFKWNFKFIALSLGTFYTKFCMLWNFSSDFSCHKSKENKSLQKKYKHTHTAKKNTQRNLRHFKKYLFSYDLLFMIQQKLQNN